MSQIYDNWDRLVRFTLRREQLRLIALRTPSLSPSPSSSSPSTTSSSPPSLNKIPTLLIGEAFDYSQILLATNYFSDSNFIKRGRSGELYYGVLHDGTGVVIKKMDYSSPYCVSELQVFGTGKDSHASLVPLLGHCSDGFLVYKHMSRGDLSSLILKSHTDPHDENSSSLSLDWISKLKIAVGTAEALCYLHHECSPPLVHRDIQASSIFLDDNYQVRLGSLGDVCEGHEHEEEEEKKAKKQNNTMRFQRPPRVPEKISSVQGITQTKISSVQGTSGKPATYAYDVYCFGKVLLELITGELATSTSYAAIERSWMHTFHYYDDESIVNIEPYIIVDELFDERTAMAIVARCCLHPNSSRRPLIENVLTALENPLKFFLSNNSSRAIGLRKNSRMLRKIGQDLQM